MFLSEALSINSKGHLEIGGCDAVELAREFGTPLYVMDEGLIRRNCSSFRDSLMKHYGGNGLILYASKAFCAMAMCRIIESEGLGLDVASGGELYTAIKSGFSMERVYFHGNNKTEGEIELAVENNVGRIIIDNREELFKVHRLASGLGRKVRVTFRIKPGIDAHTHDAVKTGMSNSKFGLTLENGEALEVISQAKAMENIIIKGIHCHIGSQLFHIAPYKAAAQTMVDFLDRIRKTLGVELEEINLGGGFGVRYTARHSSIDIDSFIGEICRTVKEECEKRGIKPPALLLEPGRSIVAPAGITLYTVGTVKGGNGFNRYIIVDGGMADNPRYVLYQAPYEALLAHHPQAPAVSEATIAGKSCESGDILIRNIAMPEVKPGDILAVLATGAYNYSMSSNYNRLPRPAVLLVRNGRARVIVKREDYEDIVRNDIIPDDL